MSALALLGEGGWLWPAPKTELTGVCAWHAWQEDRQWDKDAHPTVGRSTFKLITNLLCVLQQVNLEPAAC
jgi:hypothetical protein